MTILSHPTGNAFVRALLAKLQEKKRLRRFFTTVSAPAPAILARLPAALRNQLSRRAFDLPPEIISTQSLREIIRLAVPALAAHETGWASVDRVYGALDAKVARWLERHGVNVAYAYEDGALRTFQAARRIGAHCAYELPIAYWETTRALLKEEAERLPEWEPTLLSPRDSTEKTDRKRAELELADTVICPSQFVLDSLPPALRSSKRCILSPFGSPPSGGPKPARATGPLRVLFAGSMSQRKGLADLFVAMKLLRRDDIELVVMGSALAPMEFYRRQYSSFIYEPPRDRAAVLDLMRTCDVLVLPSIVEGRALVQQEAMSCGLPVIATRNAGAEDIIEESSTGFLIPIRAPQEIARRLEILAGHRDLLATMSAGAIRKAATYSWDAYASTIEAALPS